MTPEQFVDALIKEVVLVSIEATMQNLEEPPGRRPARELVELSAWYRALPENDQRMINRVVTQAVNFTTFGFLSVLDGVRQVEHDVEKGELRLTLRKGTQEFELNNQRDCELRDVFKQRLEEIEKD